MTLTTCAVCGAATAETVIQANDYPAYLLPMPPQAAAAVLAGPLTVVACRQCGHMQQSDVDDELQRRLYQDYYSHYAVDASEALVPHYRVPFEDFFEHLGATGQLPGGRVLEIGCSAGERVDLWRRYFSGYVGIDASTRVELARQRHADATFIQGFFPEALPQGRFNGVVTQFNLEHIPDLGAFLSAAHALTEDGAVMLVQVPDAADWTRKGQPNFIAHEHIHYFRRPTLELVLRRFGWSAFAWGEQGPSLICAARRAPPQPVATSSEAEPLAQPLAQAGLFAARPPLPPGKLAFYGVGPLLFWLLDGIDNSRIAAVIDDNPLYHGLALPCSGVVVQPSTPEAFAAADAVVLSLNPMYHPKVLDKLRSLTITVDVCALADGQWKVAAIP